MFVYTVAFLGLVLGVLPWVFSRLDVYVAAAHVEIGWVRAIGLALFAVSLTLYLRASYVLTRRGKGAFVEVDPPTELVVVGPYGYVRNPIVAFLLGAMLGEAIALSSTGVLIMFFVFLTLAHRQVTRLEEPLLRKRFGRSYDEYCAHVPRWIPRRTRWEQPRASGAGPRARTSF